MNRRRFIGCIGCGCAAAVAGCARARARKDEDAMSSGPPSADGHEHHRLAVENLKAMEAVGLERWIAKQPKVMFCPGWRF